MDGTVGELSHIIYGGLKTGKTQISLLIFPYIVCFKIINGLLKLINIYI